MAKKILTTIITLGLFVSLLAVTSCSSNGDDENYESHYEPAIYELEPTTSEPDPVIYEPEPIPTAFIALGDSVSSGFGLSGYAGRGSFAEYRHSRLFFNKLYENGIVEEYLNLAVTGYNTTDVLQLLHSTESDVLEYFYNASIITLNIGGNNILIPFMAGGTATGENMGFGFFDILINAFSLLTGNLSPELSAVLNESVEYFNYEFAEILNWLEVHAPYAELIVNTVYNPIPRYLGSMPVTLSAVADELIIAINQNIMEESVARGFLVVDIYAYFDGRLDLMLFNLNPEEGDTSLDLIHPSAEGHQLIAELHYYYFMQNARRE